MTRNCYQRYDYFEIFQQEGLDRLDFLSRIKVDATNYLKSIPNGNVQKIPLITHHVYCFFSENSRPLGEVDIEKTVKSIERLNKVHEGFIHLLWTDRPGNIPNEIKELPRMIIKGLSEFKDHILYKNVEYLLEKAIHDRSFASSASNIIRLMAVKEYGGMYTDMDFEIYDAGAILQHTRNLNFFAAFELPYKNNDIGNCFFAASPEHPIIQEALSLVERNLPCFYTDCIGSNEIPLYVQRPCTKKDGVINRVGVLVINVAYEKANNHDDNMDLVFPSPYVNDVDFARAITPKSRCHKECILDCENHIEKEFEQYVCLEDTDICLERLGSDLFCSTWGRPDFTDQINYPPHELTEHIEL